MTQFSNAIVSKWDGMRAKAVDNTEAVRALVGEVEAQEAARFGKGEGRRRQRLSGRRGG